ncbi:MULTISPECIES: bifunctional nicotinamidase/pyrazinamidase [Thalassobaculum]|uniref:Nicotinamidase n=1 Tax=Thalassobaculum litoreum DSM 18839 TaxID=1123362 RepID=A0A8G2BLV7_9PROT|nr:MULTISPECIES: bifunctional nicotinamidase/pyrazinamidase [Thalassobaculum]SDG45888.1 nicotinamidase/pyrazinamidase [Thalassobaculum litoreum DSM 18839]
MTATPLRETDCLVLIDLQYDFMPGGALAVAEGDLLVPVANRLAERFPHVVATQDWHPAGHSSFASQHSGREPFTTVEMPYGTQTLWPDHCVQGTPGAELHKDLALDRAELILRKGYRRDIDSYSAFLENDQSTPTGLGGYLFERGIQRLFFAGLATDFCVAWSVLDARMAGFEAVILTDACRAIDLAGSLDAAMAGMAEVGAVITESSAVLG